LDQLPEDAFNVAMIECNISDGDLCPFHAGEPIGAANQLMVTSPMPNRGSTQIRSRLAVGPALFQLASRRVRIRKQNHAVANTAMPLTGIRDVQTNDRNVEYRDSLDIHCYTASVDFGMVSGSPAIERDLQEHGDVLLDGTFRNHEKPDHSFIKQASDLFPVNDLWWSLADANYSSHLGSTCGCSHNHDHFHQCHLPVFPSCHGRKPNL
jgi:hypothetical protein